MARSSEGSADGRPPWWKPPSSATSISFNDASSSHCPSCHKAKLRRPTPGENLEGWFLHGLGNQKLWEHSFYFHVPIWNLGGAWWPARPIILSLLQLRTLYSVFSHLHTCISHGTDTHRSLASSNDFHLKTRSYEWPCWRHSQKRKGKQFNITGQVPGKGETSFIRKFGRQGFPIG